MNGVIKEFNIKEYIVEFGRKLNQSSLIKEIDVRVSFRDGTKILNNSCMDVENEVG